MGETIDGLLLQKLFPSELMEYFDLKSFNLVKQEGKTQEYWLIEFDEKNIIPAGYDPKDYESKGFTEGKQIQDFPIRGRAVFLKIKKRRWRHIQTGAIIQRDFTFIAEGVKLTKELSDFLKDRGR